MKQQKSDKKVSKLRIFEAALLIALSVALCSGLWARAQQQGLSRELVRLHVIARSDSEADQLLKLRVRDKALMWLAPLLEDAQDARQAQEIIEAQLEHLEASARAEIERAGFDYGAAAVIENERYPTREYGSFALPAGDYVSLKITLGDGGGKNWWCVVFPPLCMTAVEEQEVFSKLSDENAELISSEDGEYILKFHIIDRKSVV